jgi:hypothetical protein
MLGVELEFIPEAAAHWEHLVSITEDGPQIFTVSDNYQVSVRGVTTEPASPWVVNRVREVFSLFDPHLQSFLGRLAAAF